MKKRITKTKLLKHLTKLVNETKYVKSNVMTERFDASRYNTLLEIRDYINTHRI